MTTPDFEPPLPAFDMLEKPYEKTPLEWAHEIVPAGFAGPVWNGIRAGIAAAIADVRQELIKHQANEITRLANEQASKIGAKVKEAVEAKVLASLSLPSDVKICFTILEGVNPPATATDGRVNPIEGFPAYFSAVVTLEGEHRYSKVEAIAALRDLSKCLPPTWKTHFRT